MRCCAGSDCDVMKGGDEGMCSGELTYCHVAVTVCRWERGGMGRERRRVCLSRVESSRDETTERGVAVVEGRGFDELYDGGEVVPGGGRWVVE